jgi:hypothetical protein
MESRIIERLIEEVEGVEIPPEIAEELVEVEIEGPAPELGMPGRYKGLEDWEIAAENWGLYRKNHGKRVCAVDGCGTILRYTRRDDHCSIHNPFELPIAGERLATPPAEAPVEEAATIAVERFNREYPGVSGMVATMDAAEDRGVDWTLVTRKIRERSVAKFREMFV